MENRYSRRQLEELYCCTIFRESGFDGGGSYWAAHGLPLKGGGCLFTYADGWDLDELHEHIRRAVREHCIAPDES